MKTTEFKTYHPIVRFVYFVLVIGFSCFFMHPVSLSISLLCSFTYLLLLKGRDALKFALTILLPMAVIMTIINPLFNHQGTTIITYLPEGNPLTFESAVYGLSASAMIISVICCFSCFNEVMTSDALMYLFGRIIPSLSLIFSMTLRFIPKFLKDFKDITKTQKCQGIAVPSGSILQRAKSGLTILSIGITKALENSVETSDSMKARGYGLPGRTSFSIFTFTKKDAISLIYFLLLGAYVLLGAITGGMDYTYFPSIAGSKLTAFSISVFASYFALCVYPVITELWEVIRWKSIKSRI